jgi:molybdate transport system regulatory protein
MRLSIRNQFRATVESVTAGPAMTAVHARLVGGPEIVAAITSDAATELKLRADSAVQVLIKSTEVSVGIEPIGRISIRNRIPGTVLSVDEGAAMTVVKIEMAAGGVLVSAITAESAEDLGLTVGLPVTGLVKSTDVSIAVD